MTMLSEFADDFATGIFEGDDGMAVSAAYNPSGGTGKTVSAIMTYGEDLEDAQWRAALQASAMVHLLESDVAIVGVRLSHGIVTNGPFSVGETVTGGTSGSTGVITSVGSGSIDITSITGPGFALETISSGTKTAEVSATEDIETKMIPTQQDTITIGGVSWSVARILQHSAGTWKLELRRDLRPTFRK